MLILELGAVMLLGCAVFIFLNRHSGPTRSVAHLLYDTEHPKGDRADRNA